MISPLQETRAPSFRFLEFEQVDAVPGHGSRGSSACQAAIRLRRGVSNGRLVQLCSAFQQPREMNVLPGEEDLCQSGVATERLVLLRLPFLCSAAGWTCLLPTQMQLVLLLSPPVHHHLGVPPGCAGFVTWHGAVGLCQICISPSESIPLYQGLCGSCGGVAHPSHLPASADAQPNRGKLREGFQSPRPQGRTPRRKERRRKERRSAEHERLLLRLSARSLPCQCCRSGRLLQRLQPSLVLSSGKDADCGKFS